MAGQDKKTTTAPNPINTTQDPNWGQVNDTKNCYYCENIYIVKFVEANYILKHKKNVLFETKKKPCLKPLV
jgi:hypothetical protein